MARTLIVRTHFDTTDHTPMYAVVHSEQCTDLADTTDSTDTAMTALIPGESVTFRDIHNEFIHRDTTYPVVAHERCLQALADAEAADDQVATVSPTTHELATELGVPHIDITRAAESWFRVHGSGTAFFPTLRDDAFVVRPAFVTFVRELLTHGPTTGPQPTRTLDDDAPDRETADATSPSSSSSPSGSETAADPQRSVGVPAKLIPFIERAERYGLTVAYAGNVSQFDILHRWDISSANPVDETQILLHWHPGQRGGRVHISHYRGPLSKGRKSRKSIVTVTRQVARIVIDNMGESLQRHRDREAAKVADQPTPMRQQPQQQQQAADHHSTDERPATGAEIREGVRLEDLRAGMDVQVALKPHTHTWVRIHTIDEDPDRRHAHIVVLEGKQAGQHIRHFGFHPMQRYGNYTVRIPAEPVRQPEPQTLDRRRGSLPSAHIRNELLLGPVHVLTLGEKRTGDRVAQVSYELNVIDGWTRVREWTDESGLIWEGESTAQSRVREVLDAAPGSAHFIAAAHLWWIKALDAAGHHRRAGVQRRALNSALNYHGLALAEPARRSTTKDTASAEAR